MKRPPNCDQDRGGEAGRLRLHVERRNGEADSDEDDLERLLENMRRELKPRTQIEHLLTQRLARVAWRLVADDPAAQVAVARARELRILLRSVQSLRILRAEGRCGVSKRDLESPREPKAVRPPYHVEGLAAGEFEGLAAQGAASMQCWRDRLEFDRTISRHSPVVKGTWVTASQVVALIVEGQTWDDILNDYPELTPDDLRACLSYTLGE